MLNIISACIMLPVILASCIKDTHGDGLKPGDSLPEFSVQMNDGSTVSGESLKGSISCIVFFHTSCSDCRATLPVVQKIYDTYSEKGVKFALISREEATEEIDIFWKETGLSMPFSAQTDRDIYSKFAMSVVPRIYISDRDGIIRYIYTDDPVPSYEDIETSLNDLLQQ